MKLGSLILFTVVFVGGCVGGANDTQGGSEEQPAENVEISATIDTASCTFTGRDDFGAAQFSLTTSGIASGPENTLIALHDSTDASDLVYAAGGVLSCTDWTEVNGNCNRWPGQGQPATTTWTSSASTELVSGKTIYFGVIVDGQVIASTSAVCPDVGDVPT